MVSPMPRPCGAVHTVRVCEPDLSGGGLNPVPVIFEALVSIPGEFPTLPRIPLKSWPRSAAGSRRGIVPKGHIANRLANDGFRWGLVESFFHVLRGLYFTQIVVVRNLSEGQVSP